jgi:hypothetical protein
VSSGASGCANANELGDQYSSVVIEQLRQRHEIIRPEMECKLSDAFSCEVPCFKPSAGIEMDVRDLKFEDGAFDVVIDKGSSL